MHRIITLLFLTQILMIAASCRAPSAEIGQSEATVAEVFKTPRADSPIPNTFIDPIAFQKTAGMKGSPINGFPVAGIVNHHTLAADIQAKFFISLREVRPHIKTFIILSPDHFNGGPGIATERYPYATPVGIVAIDDTWNERLNQLGVWSAAGPQAFAKEHGIGALAPFIAREFPDANMVPIFLQIDYPINQTQALGQRIAKHLDDRTFILISSDMSHYLSHDEAQKRDQQTKGWLMTNDWDKLSSASDEYTDSHVSFAVLKNLFRALDMEPRFQILDQRISTEYGADPNETTSYITGVYAADP